MERGIASNVMAVERASAARGRGSSLEFVAANHFNDRLAQLQPSTALASTNSNCSYWPQPSAALGCD